MASDTHIPPDQPLTAQQPPAMAQSLRRGHEITDAKIKPIIVFVIVLFVGGALLQGGAWAVWRLIEHRQAMSDPTPSPFAPTAANPYPNAPPEPRLQPSVTHNSQPSQDMQGLHEHWQKLLSSYGKIEGQPDRARIPIERAMQLAIERGLPGGATTRATTRP